MEKVIELMHRFLGDESELTNEEMELYQLSLTHSTYSPQNNERLAFLGDAILKHSIREHLYQTNPSDCKGILTVTSSRIESNYNYAKIAINLDVFSYMQIGNPALKSSNKTVNAQALEALFGAVYLSRGMELVDKLVRKYFFGIV